MALSSLENKVFYEICFDQLWLKLNTLPGLIVNTSVTGY